MRISPNYRDILADEIRFCRTKIDIENDPRKKVYYYSGLYGITRRIYNLEFDPQVQFIDFVFNATYNTMLTRIAAFNAGDTTIPITNDFFVKLNNCLERLEGRIRANEDTYDILEKLINLTSTIDGNGYYLVEKGIPVYTEY
ncbi:MAG: hypothetical protein Q7U60_11710 [Candidatus Methanoperedens sp.]|nr:hypothetical protein [Candidatus Methanoperedens sp.]